MTVQVPPLHNPNIPQQLLLLATAILELLKGRDNSVSSFTLTANATTTTVTDNLFQSDMMPIWTATTLTAAVALASLRVTSRTNGSFVVTHANTADVDKTFLYSRRG